MKRTSVLFFAAALFVLSACGVNETAPSAVLSAEAAVTATPSPSPEPTPVPTATPAPFELYGVSVRWNDTELDLRNAKITDAGAALADALPMLPKLRRVDFTGCTLSHAEKGAFQDAFPEITFVWSVGIYNYRTTTDTDYFIPNPDAGVQLTGSHQGPYALQYCRSLVALDVGHCHLDNAEFVVKMPHLRYLILADDPIHDLSPLSELKELEWLELFNSSVRDLSPLIGCTALRDLNICYIPASGEAIVETLSQMPCLRRVWCSGTNLTFDQLDALSDALPDTEIWYRAGDESTGGTWRYDEDYYAMRDAFHMYYMDIKGNTVERMTEDELNAVHEKYWGY